MATYAPITIDRAEVMNSLGLADDDRSVAIWMKYAAADDARAAATTDAGAEAFCADADLKQGTDGFRWHRPARYEGMRSAHLAARRARRHINDMIRRPPLAPPIPVSRRAVVLGATSLWALGLLPQLTPDAIAEATKAPRRLKLFNANTKETFEGVYREGDAISAPAHEALNHLLRDHHENETVAIDPALFDLIWNLQERYRAIGRGQVTINIHSGYRTKKTNDRLIPEGAAQSSLHLAGQAVDLTVQGYGIYLLGPQAQRVATGGLGLYWADKFVHLDTGPRRFWYSRT